MSVLIINGPNIDQIGLREQKVYGNTSIHQYMDLLKQEFSIESLFLRSEKDIIEALYAAGDSYKGVLLNAGAFTHTSLAIADAISAISIPVIEIHVSNIYTREFYRKTSFIAEKCEGSISGFGLESYRLGLIALQ